MASSTSTPTRPTSLPRTGIPAPDGRRFPWGPIQAIHAVGNIQIVEYLHDASTNSSQPEVWATHGRTEFHAYIDGRDMGESFLSLDSALVGAIARKRVGPNSQAAFHFDLITLGSIPGDTEDRA